MHIQKWNIAISYTIHENFELIIKSMIKAITFLYTINLPHKMFISVYVQHLMASKSVYSAFDSWGRYLGEIKTVHRANMDSCEGGRKDSRQTFRILRVLLDRHSRTLRFQYRLSFKRLPKISVQCLKQLTQARCRMSDQRQMLLCLDVETHTQIQAVLVFLNQYVCFVMTHGNDPNAYLKH